MVFFLLSIVHRSIDELADALPVKRITFPLSNVLKEVRFVGVFAGAHSTFAVLKLSNIHQFVGELQSALAMHLVVFPFSMVQFSNS